MKSVQQIRKIRHIEEIFLGGGGFGSFSHPQIKLKIET